MSVASPGEKALLRNVASVDVEDYFHAEAFAGTVKREDWETLPSRVEGNTYRLLELFSKLNVRGTFFVLGWVAERYPGLVREIAEAGHELACHSYLHRLIYKLDPQTFREDTARAKNAIEQAGGKTVYGYRAPTFSVTMDSLWALEVLAELGFTYDSSIFPVRHDRYGIPEAPRSPFRVRTASGSIVEFPMATFRLWGEHNLPTGGGGYLRLLPWWYTRYGLGCAAREGIPFISYVHPWEVDADQPRLNVGFKTRIRHYTNLDRTYERLERMLQTSAFGSFQDSGLQAIAKDYDFSCGRGHGSSSTR